MSTSIPSGVAQLSLTLKQGADTTITMTWLNDAGSPMNLTGYTMNLPIRAFVGSPTTLLNLSSQNSSGSYIQLGGSAGTITLIFANADTQKFIPGGLPVSSLQTGGFPVSQIGVHNLQFTDPTGKIGYLFEGPINLDPSV